MARPPAARPGAPAQSAGRDVCAGVGPRVRLLGSRTSSFELWSPLRPLLVEDVGLTRLGALWGKGFDTRVWRRFSAFLSQAETFYLSAEGMPAESRPLVAYYFALNLSKAYLSCVAPSVTGAKLMHGLSDAFDSKQRYWFSHERAKIAQRGVARELATRTGSGFCYPKNEVLTIERLAPYLAETADLFEDAVMEPPRLVPISAVEVWSDKSSVWLRVEVDRGELRRRAMGPASLPTRAALFGRQFRHVQSERPTASFESIGAWTYGGKRLLAKFPELKAAFEKSLIHSNRGATGARHMVVISDREKLLSQEAVSFVVFHHLCNMVRYRPEQVAKLSASKWFFLFTTWIPRAMENYLLAMTSRILQEEVRIG